MELFEVVFIVMMRDEEEVRKKSNHDRHFKKRVKDNKNLKSTNIHDHLYTFFFFQFETCSFMAIV